MPSSRSRELHGPRPPPPGVAKDPSRKAARRAPTTLAQPNAGGGARRRAAPVVVHVRAQRVVHARPQDFMSVVQRLTGKPLSPPPAPPPLAAAMAAGGAEVAGGGGHGDPLSLALGQCDGHGRGEPSVAALTVPTGVVSPTSFFFTQLEPCTGQLAP